MEITFDNLAISCAYEKYRSHEYFVPEHFLGIHLSGESQVETANGKNIYKEGSIILVRKNQLFRATKIPGKNGEYKAVSIFLTEQILRKYIAKNQIREQNRYEGESIITIDSNTFIKAYFSSLIPYTESDIKQTHSLADIKVFEAIELLLRQDPDLEKLLFDFSEPHKIDLEKFMMNNYKFNIPISQFAKLTGRSVSTFKRDFKNTFEQSPRKWLQNKRLSEAYRLIKNGQKPMDFYLDIGFEDLSHFYFSFKQKYGITPAELL